MNPYKNKGTMSDTMIVSQTQPALGFAYKAFVIEGIKRTHCTVIYMGFDRSSGRHEVRWPASGLVYKARRINATDKEPEFEFRSRD